MTFYEVEEPEFDDYRDALTEAQEKLFDAIEALKWVANETNNAYARNYVIAHLEMLTHDDHDYLSANYNVGKWIADLKKTADEEADE